MTTRLYQVDAFTSEPFKGNPAAVCLLDGPATVEWMQLVAREMNLSETAYLYPQDDGFQLRWFTPGVEVELCGHATLASAHILWETGTLGNDEPAIFHTASGRLEATKAGGLITMDFPTTVPELVAVPKNLIEALDNIEPLYVGQTVFDYMIEIGSARQVRDLTPDMSLLKQLDGRGFLVTATSDNPEYDFISRCFFPGLGIDEDPVTGSAHCTLGPYWAEKLGKNPLQAYQASIRGGALTVEVCGKRTYLTGQAVTVAEIDLL
ncbi:PhzF family phenazine biosynthesis protein [Candidatus Neomarinimicrobiota bacterium]